jgi:hypothetical protein
MVAGLSCAHPLASPHPEPSAILRIAFTDGTAEVGLDRRPPPGAWDWMDAGVWAPLPLVWDGETRAQAQLSRTAPDWLVLRDPNGGIHRLVLQERPDPVAMPSPGSMRGTRDMDDEARGALAVLGLAWVLSFVRR